MQARSSSPPPLKRSRRAASPPSQEVSNGHASGSGQPLQPLSLSILGVEPLDEFIKEIADFVHHMIVTRPDHPNGKVEVEAKVGVMRDRSSGQRLGLPVLVETSTCYFPIDCIQIVDY
jgi:polynucleotide 5'-triphosphatase